MLKNKKQQAGFTLIEMMIAVGIISILAAIAYPSYQNYIIRARMEEARSKIMSNVRMMEEYYAQNRYMCGTFNSDKSACATMPEVLKEETEDKYTTGIIPDTFTGGTSSYIITSKPKDNVYSSNTLASKEVYLLYYSNGSGFAKCTQSGFNAVVSNAKTADGTGCSVM